MCEERHYEVGNRSHTLDMDPSVNSLGPYILPSVNLDHLILVTRGH